MKILNVLLSGFLGSCVLISAHLKAEEVAEKIESKPQPIHYQSTPQGWRFEPIAFPFEFAPNLKYKGVEELLFMPGMYKPAETDFFSYAFVWAIEKNALLSLSQLESDMYEYYIGLYNAVSGGNNPQPIKLTFEGDEKSFSGTILWTEPFATKKEQTLNFKGRQELCASSNQLRIWFEVSPTNYIHPLWKKLAATKKVACH